MKTRTPLRRQRSVATVADIELLLPKYTERMAAAGKVIPTVRLFDSPDYPTLAEDFEAYATYAKRRSRLSQSECIRRLLFKALQELKKIAPELFQAPTPQVKRKAGPKVELRPPEESSQEGTA